MFETHSRVSQIALQVILTIAMIPFLVPLVTMVQRSFQGRGWGNYKAVFQVPGFGRFFVNSFIISAVTITIVLVLTMMASFGFAKLRVRNKEFFFWALMVAMTLPEVVLIAPLYTTAAKLGMMGTFWSVILPIAALQIPFTVMITRTYMEGIPDTLIEAALIDGANTPRIFWSIIVPMARPMAVALGVLVLLASWNAYLLPKVFLANTDNMGVVTLLPEFFKQQYANDTPKLFAATVVIAIPEIIAYVALQKQFERGMAAGAIK